jgi:hypothetical protein
MRRNKCLYYIDVDAFMYVLDVGLKTDYYEALPSCDFNSVLTGIEFNF